MLLVILERIINKVARTYREALFRKHTGQKAEGLRIRGSIKLINYNITVGKNVKIYPGVMIYGDGPICIGNNVSIGKDTILYASARGGITIGDDTSIAAQCYIIDADHGMEREINIQKQNNSVERVMISEDVWIAANCTILKGSNIKKGAVIGAKSLVKGEIEEYGIAMGIPARVVKRR